MLKNNLKKKIQEILSFADIKIDGTRPWDIQVYDDNLYREVLTEGSIGFGEAYMGKYWDTDDLDTLMTKIFRANLHERVKPFSLAIPYIKSKFANMQKKSKAFEIGEKHYDIGNALYKAMLDKRMTYTCGYWKNAANLDEAQEAKLDLTCHKIGLKEGMNVLDIGCGWGSFAKFAAEKYGAKVVGVTVSKEQVELGNRMCKGLPVEIKLQDYRDVQGEFDRIVSLGMFEHVGNKNYKIYMRAVHNLLKDDGLFLLHTIGWNESVSGTDPWIEKYIFPNSVLPSMKQIATAIEGVFIVEDWHNFGTDYTKTLLAWFENFNNNWDSLKELYDERFYRMWKFYLLSCAALFRARESQLWQIVLSKKGITDGYDSIR